MAWQAQQVADGVWNFGHKHINFYAIEDGGKITLVDAGVRHDCKRLLAGLEQIGRSPADIAAVVLTHATFDTTGCAEFLRTKHGVPVFVHAADQALATRRESYKPELNKARPTRPLYAYTLHLMLPRGWILGGAMPFLFMNLDPFSVPRVDEVTAYDAGSTLDVPGRLTVRHAPGATPGSCILSLPGRGILFSGDALVTRNMHTGAEGPQIGPRRFLCDTAKALDSLSAFNGLDAKLLLPTHGPPWTDGVPAALAAARERAAP